MQDLNDILYFVQVVEHGSFTGASRALGMAKSQLSFRVARLEEHLGVRLIQRTTRRSHVTEIGRRYYDQCRLMLAAAERAQEVIDDAQALPRGRLRVACPVMFAQLLLAPVLVGFLRRHPDVQVDLDICHHQVDVVANGYDIAFRVRASVQDSSLIVRSFGMDPQMLVASADLLQRIEPAQQPADLRHLPSVSTISAEGRHFWTLLDAAGHAQRVEHHPSLVSDDLQVLFQAVTGGLGIAQLPRFICREPVARGQLVPVLPAWSLPPGNVHAVYPSRHGHTPAMRCFIDYMAEHLPDMLAQAQRGAPGGDVKPLLAVA
ncbi:LysR substrate-binding domain-containing protein [Dyella marensis]|jgi:DNA-binding transcriptional LysR family regulator|uniref:DNA-binding transcriptional regulator, LysR family n=1 Tax=Dyella marensis TaxID=500610 RepID=A0A1I2HBX5_9GAMM|nr:MULTISPECIES: LysR substrate-binding domain-containing protein [Dyella]SFF26810.1 DNA-binding transcriptional regulator, LysR family [Dyella marensis]